MSVIRFDSIGQNSVDRVSKLLAGVQGGAYKATSNALRRAGESAKTQAGRFAATEYTITKGDFMHNVTIKTQVSGSGGVASMSIGFAGYVLPLLSFDTSFSRDGRIRTKVKRNGGAASLQHAFAAKVFGPIGIFERVGAGRFPVEQKYGPSTGHMMQNEDVIQKMEDTIHKTYEARIEHEITRILNGWGV